MKLLLTLGSGLKTAFASRQVQEIQSQGQPYCRGHFELKFYRERTDQHKRGLAWENCRDPPIRKV